MTYDEKEALLTYLEAQLINFCMVIEQRLGDNRATHLIYESSYDILVDMEQTLETQMELMSVEK